MRYTFPRDSVLQVLWCTNHSDDRTYSPGGPPTRAGGHAVIGSRTCPSTAGRADHRPAAVRSQGDAASRCVSLSAGPEDERHLPSYCNVSLRSDPYRRGSVGNPFTKAAFKDQNLISRIDTHIIKIYINSHGHIC